MYPKLGPSCASPRKASLRVGKPLFKSVYICFPFGVPSNQLENMFLKRERERQRQSEAQRERERERESEREKADPKARPAMYYLWLPFKLHGAALDQPPGRPTETRTGRGIWPSRAPCSWAPAGLSIQTKPAMRSFLTFWEAQFGGTRQSSSFSGQSTK